MHAGTELPVSESNLRHGGDGGKRDRTSPQTVQWPSGRRKHAEIPTSRDDHLSFRRLPRRAGSESERLARLILRRRQTLEGITRPPRLPALQRTNPLSSEPHPCFQPAFDSPSENFRTRASGQFPAFDALETGMKNTSTRREQTGTEPDFWFLRFREQSGSIRRDPRRRCH